MFVTINDVKYNILEFTAYRYINNSKYPNGLEIHYTGGTKLYKGFASTADRDAFVELLGTTYVQINNIYYNALYFTAYYNEDVVLPDGTTYNTIVHYGIYGAITKLVFKFETEAERTEFTEFLDSNSVGGGGLLQYDSRSDFPDKGKEGSLYLAKDTGQTYYWDKVTQTYVETGTAGRTGIYQSDVPLDDTIGSTTTVLKSQLSEVVKPTVDYSEGSEVIGPNGVHGVIVSSSATDVTVKTTVDLGTDSFIQVDDATQLPATGQTFSLYYLKDVKEFRIWNSTTNSYEEPSSKGIFFIYEYNENQKHLSTTIGDTTVLGITNLGPNVDRTKLAENQLVYDLDGTVGFITAIDLTADTVTVKTITISGGSVSQEIKRPFQYEVGYDYVITDGGQDYVVGDIVETTEPSVFIEVVAVDTTGAITDVKFTREKTASTQGTNAIIDATQNTNIFIIPDAYWALNTITYDIVLDSGAQVEFYKDDDVLVKYNMGADSKVYQFTFDKVDGFIIVSSESIESGSPIEFAQTLPKNATTMKKGTLYVNDTGYSFTPDNSSLIYHENPIQFVTSLPATGNAGELYVNLVDKTINTYSGGQWIVLGGGANTVFDEKTNFTIPGDPNTLYVATDENKIYRYDLTDGDYVCLTTTGATVVSYSDVITGNGTGGTSFQLTHNLNTTKLVVSVYDKATGEAVPFELTIVDQDRIEIGWGDNLSTSTQYQVDILGWI